MRYLVVLVVALGCIGACTRVNLSGHTAKDDRAHVQSAARPAQSQVARITLEFTPVARQQADDDVRFNSDALRDAINAALRARGLLDAGSAGAGRVAVILVDEFEVRATSNVVLFGRLPSAGLLAATIHVRDGAAGVSPEFRVRTDAPLSIPQRNAQKNPLQKLYRKFGETLATDLAAAMETTARR